MGRRHKGRQLDGVFLLDKPPGVSSNGVLQYVKRLYGAAKAGHTGALDPLATGMLPLTFGEATKFSQFLLDADKRYQTTAKLGIRTDSSDADGKVIERQEVGEHVSETLIKELLIKHFSGEIEQVPSMFSALKYKGQPLYKLARKGETVEVKSRRVQILNIELLAYRPELGEIDLDVRCSKGTYIRSIVEDLGLMLGCGAHVTVLRRLESGPYKAAMMITIEQLDALAATIDDETEQQRNQRLDALMIPTYSPVEHLPKLSIDKVQQLLLFQGKPVELERSAQSLVRIHLSDDDQFLGIGEINEAGILRSKRLLSTS
ncbi:tRNA pseudouridine(55) synthase TruB ['Osedax' symbiont bacterium Rs2_46_30_T18]|nr:tRNA pseudouridine(55) synthase TruB ['Osedax' symbiont bacterium Rs2_46_30_T18]